MSLPAWIYFHGQPGSADELELFQAKPEFDWVPDRSIASSGNADEQFEALAEDLKRRFPNRRFVFVAFSLGTACALRVAAHLGDRVQRIELISAAAPLELGNFLPDMAGRAVFALAIEKPGMFSLLTRAQCLISMAWPMALLKLVFQSAQGADVQLVSSRDFRTRMAHVLSKTLSNGATGYKREILAYVAPWADTLDTVKSPVRFWHGSKDNWSPPQMAHALKATLLCPTQLVVLDGMSHYSTLREAMKTIAQENRATAN